MPKRFHGARGAAALAGNRLEGIKPFRPKDQFMGPYQITGAKLSRRYCRACKGVRAFRHGRPWSPVGMAVSY
jgi:hypothetical protein